MHSLIEPSFFFTSNTGAPHGETLGRINFFSSNSSNCFFSSANSDGDIRYGAIDTGLVPGTNSIENSTSLSGGNSFTSSGKTSGNSHTTGNSLLATFSLTFINANIIYNVAPSPIASFTCLAVISRSSVLTSSGKITVFAKQLI